LPGVVVEAQESGVYPDIGSPFVDLVGVTGAEPRHQGHPGGELPLHLDVEVGGIQEVLQQLGHMRHPLDMTLEVPDLDDGRQDVHIAGANGLLDNCGRGLMGFLCGITSVDLLDHPSCS